jgi:hypothetical protein
LSLPTHRSNPFSKLFRHIIVPDTFSNVPYLIVIGNTFRTRLSFTCGLRSFLLSDRSFLRFSCLLTQSSCYLVYHVSFSIRWPPISLVSSLAINFCSFFAPNSRSPVIPAECSLCALQPPPFTDPLSGPFARPLQSRNGYPYPRVVA